MEVEGSCREPAPTLPLLPSAFLQCATLASIADTIRTATATAFLMPYTPATADQMHILPKIYKLASIQKQSEGRETGIPREGKGPPSPISHHFCRIPCIEDSDRPLGSHPSTGAPVCHILGCGLSGNQCDCFQMTTATVIQVSALHSSTRQEVTWPLALASNQRGILSMLQAKEIRR